MHRRMRAHRKVRGQFWGVRSSPEGSGLPPPATSALPVGHRIPSYLYQSPRNGGFAGLGPWRQTAWTSGRVVLQSARLPSHRQGIASTGNHMNILFMNPFIYLRWQKINEPGDRTSSLRFASSCVFAPLTAVFGSALEKVDIYVNFVIL